MNRKYGKYEMVRTIAQGAMGEIVLVKSDDGNEYAKNYLDQDFLQRTSDIYIPKADFLISSLPLKEYEILEYDNLHNISHNNLTAKLSGALIHAINKIEELESRINTLEMI